MEKIKNQYRRMPVTVKASIWFLICSFVQRGISFITTPIFTRLLNTSEFGDFNVFQSWLSILTVIVTLNLPWGVYPQGLIKFENERDRFTSSLQGLLLVLVGIWTGVYIVFHTRINSLLGMTTSRIIAMLILMWTSSVFYFWSAYERSTFQYRKLVIITLVVSILKPSIGIILVRTQVDKVTARIWGLVAVEFVCYCALFVKQMGRGRVFIDCSIWKYALAFNIALLPHYLSQTILSSADRIMIERMISKDKAGIYSLAYSLSLLMLIFNSSVEQAINPWIYRQIKDNRISKIKSVVYPALFTVAILNILLMYFAPEIIKIFAPSSYYEARWIIPPVSMSVYFMFLYDMFAVFELYYEKTRYMSSATAFVAILNIMLNYIFIKKFGYYAAGYTTLFCYLFYALFHYLVMRLVCLKGEEQPFSLKYLLCGSIAFLGAGMIITNSYRSDILRYSLLGVTISVLAIKHKDVVKIMHLIVNVRKDT